MKPEKSTERSPNGKGGGTVKQQISGAIYRAREARNCLRHLYRASREEGYAVLLGKIEEAGLALKTALTALGDVAALAAEAFQPGLKGRGRKR